MSYFSHNPEAWLEIEQKGIARKMASYSGMDGPNEIDASCDAFQAFISNLQCDISPVMRRVYDTLCEWAHGEIQDAERAYWERMIP